VLKVRLLKILDRFLGNAAVFFMRKPKPVPCENPRSLLFIRPGGIGDAVHLLRAILAVKARFPECTITVLAEKRNASIFTFCGAVSRILLYDRPSDLIKVVRGTFDAVIDTEQWHRLSAVIARLSGAPMLVGYATNNRKKLFTHPIPYCHDTYEAESFLALLKPFGISVSRPVGPALEIPEKAVAGACKKVAVLDGSPYIALFPGASIVERRWGTAKFRELAGRIHGWGFPVVVVGGKGDELAGDAIVADGSGINLAGKTSLAETAAVLKHSLLLVTGDSGLLHIAAELRVPTVSLFGPGIEKKWAPRDERHIVLNKYLSCSPCTRFGYTPQCRIGASCLDRITVDDVERAIRRILGSSHFPEVNKFLDNNGSNC
jgi:ADP-heptose:LPS heptosyltransferase